MATLYTTPRSANGLKPLVAVHHLALTATVHEVDVYGGAGQDPSYLALNPLGQVPTWVDDDGVLTESNAILQRLAEAGGGGLWGQTSAQRADVSRWLFWEASSWQPALTSVLAPRVGHVLGLTPAPAAGPAWDGPALGRAAAHLDRHLEQRSHLCREQLTIADWSVAAMLVYVPARSSAWDRWPHVAEWYRRISDADAWQTALVGSPWARTSAG